MKKSDIAVLILIVGISLIVTYFVGQAILGNTGQKQATVEVTDAISSDVKAPDSSIFNKDAINPTVSIKVSGSNNTQPFGQ